MAWKDNSPFNRETPEMKAQYLLAAAFFVAAGLSYALGYTPLLLVCLLLLMSLITYGFYAKDKAAAIRGDWRIPEKTLHGLSLCGGWPGALIAQQRLRHKTKKVSFRVVFWLTVLVNVVAFSWLHGPEGKNQLRNGVFHLENLALTEAPSSQTVSVVLYLIQYRSP
jgi:uncharacterized membrane protein YsdA (DUF1294 family)